jgi:DNA-binding PadR family transcriptional regulator
MLRYRVLGLLRDGKRLHGYALWKAYQRRCGDFIQNGRFYRALKGLADGGLIRALAPSDDDPRRTPYEITASGIAAFDDWMVDVEQLGERPEDELSSRAWFILELPHEVGQTFFLAAEDFLTARLKRLEHERERTLSRPGLSERDRAVQAILLARELERAAADHTWLRAAGDAYQRFQPAPPVAAPIEVAAPVRGRAGRTGRAQR